MIFNGDAVVRESGFRKLGPLDALPFRDTQLTLSIGVTSWSRPDFEILKLAKRFRPSHTLTIWVFDYDEIPSTELVFAKLPGITVFPIAPVIGLCSVDSHGFRFS